MNKTSKLNLVPSHELIVTDFGAAGDGLSIDTMAIQKTIEQVAKAGNGKVIFPPGRYLTGTIKLCNNLTIELMKGAVIVASTDLDDYDEDLKVNLNSGLRHYLFEGRGINNFILEGDGEIYGNGYDYWDKHPSPQSKVMLAKPQRPVIIYLVDCDNVVIKEVSIHDAPAYTVWLLGCQNVRIEGLTVRNPYVGPNTDVLDIDCCRNVLISNCNFVAGDDCIALKSDSARLGKDSSCENVLVSNCILSSTTTGIRLGYEADGPIINCVFSNLTIYNTPTGLDVLSLVPKCSFTSIRKGTPVENIVFSNIVMHDVQRAIHVWAGGEQPDQQYDAYVRGLSFCNIRAKTRGSVFIGSVGENVCVSDILLRDVFIEQVADEYVGDDGIVESPVTCWGAGHLPHSVNLRKIDGIRLENVQIKRAGNLSKDFGRFRWNDIQNGTLNGEPLMHSGELK